MASLHKKRLNMCCLPVYETGDLSRLFRVDKYIVAMQVIMP